MNDEQGDSVAVVQALVVFLLGDHPVRAQVPWRWRRYRFGKTLS